MFAGFLSKIKIHFESSIFSKLYKQTPGHNLKHTGAHFLGVTSKNYSIFVLKIKRSSINALKSLWKMLSSSVEFQLTKLRAFREVLSCWSSQYFSELEQSDDFCWCQLTIFQFLSLEERPEFVFWFEFDGRSNLRLPWKVSSLALKNGKNFELCFKRLTP